MYKKTEGIKTNKPFLISARGVIQEPQLGIVTEPYPIGEKEYFILKQRYWVDWLSPFAYASLGIFIGKFFELCAFVYQICKLSPEDTLKLKESNSGEIGNTIRILTISFIGFVVFLIINKFVPTKRKTLLANIRNVLDSTRSIIASKSKGKNSV